MFVHLFQFGFHLHDIRLLVRRHTFQCLQIRLLFIQSLLFIQIKKSLKTIYKIQHCVIQSVESNLLYVHKILKIIKATQITQITLNDVILGINCSLLTETTVLALRHKEYT